MDNESADRFVPKDINVYTWNNKQEGKDQYARFVSDFTSSIKHLRYLLEPGAVQRRLGDHPGPQPVQVALRREWKEDMRYGSLTRAGPPATHPSRLGSCAVRSAVE